MIPQKGKRGLKCQMAQLQEVRISWHSHFQIMQSAGREISVFHSFWNFTWRELGSRRWSWWAKTAAVVGLHGHDPSTS